ncbi:hypothetical protein ACFXPS_22165 [Nocardia sp. NPDC059091]|uniref:hypothetical protein n=1 Tax=Nocardia sp. NPDC059091 TaxID=3346724 RepID=UPI003676574D
MEAQTELLTQITAQIQLALPAGWSRLQAGYDAVGDYTACSALVWMQNGALFGTALPDSVVQGFANLRAGMARPETGTWLHATYWLNDPDRFSIEYDRQGIPQFEVPATAKDCARELELYPRSDENIPGWMRELLAG